MLLRHKRTPHDNRGHFGAIHQKDLQKIGLRDKTYSSALKDINVSLFPDRLEMEKLNIIIPFSSLNNFSRQELISRIIAEISATTGIPKNDLLIIRYT
jgi:hypothetical protein